MLSVLPLRGTADPLLNVIQTKHVLLANLKVLERVRSSRQPLGPALRMTLDNARFHLMTALGTIDKHLRTGGFWIDAQHEASGLPERIAAYVNEIARVKSMWNDWAENEQQTQMTDEVLAGLPVAPALVGYGVDAQSVLDATEPRTVGQSLGFLGLGLAGLGLFCVMRSL